MSKPKPLTSESIPFAVVQSVRCPKCASGPDCKCWVMAGTGTTSKTKLVPHMERVFLYLKEKP